MKKMRNIKKLLVLVKKYIHLKFLCLKYYLRKKCIANCIAFSKMPVLKIEQTQVFQGIWKNLVRFRPSAPIKKLTLVVSFFVGMIYRVSNRHSAGLTTSESDTGVSRVEKKIDKDKLEIAVKPNWVSIKQAAAILGISYTTLLAMRKEDKADGIMRIPYRGEGKNTRYYVPILEAYKSKDMDLVTKLEKEIG